LLFFNILLLLFTNDTFLFHNNFLTIKRLTPLLLILLSVIALTQCNEPAQQPIEGIWLGDYVREFKQVNTKYNSATRQLF